MLDRTEMSPHGAANTQLGQANTQHAATPMNTESPNRTNTESIPNLQTESVLFLMDAGTDVEARFLKDKIVAWQMETDFAGRCDQVCVDIARSQENISADSLAKKITEHAASIIVPVRLTWLTSVDGKNATPRVRDLLFANPRKPNNSKAASILKHHPELSRFIVAEAASMSELLNRYRTQTGQTDPNDKTFAQYIAGQAGLALDVEERRLRGGRYKVPRRVAEALRNDQRFRTELEALQQAQDQTPEHVDREVSRIMEELIAKPSTFWQDIFGGLSRFISSLGYNKHVRLDRDKLENVRKIARNHPTVFLFTHKSHIDGFVLNAVLFDEDFPPPHIIGGNNMAFFGLGFIAHHAGTIFIRRNFQDSPAYKLVLRHYLGYLLNKRFPMSWAFEGTRSRTGKLMPPRYGILKYVLESMQPRDIRNLHIIPVSINYDLIEDVKDYATEQQGGIKRPESLKWFLEYLRGMQRPMGHIHMDFGDAVVVPEAPDLSDKLELQKLAFRVGVEANRVSPLTSASIACMILLGASPRALTAEELLLDMSRCVQWARVRDIPLTEELSTSPQTALLNLLDILVTNNLVTRYDGGPEVVYAIPEDQHGEASYYRNTVAHHFVSKAITEMALMKLTVVSPETPVEAFWEEVERLRDFFKFEFFYADKQQSLTNIKSELAIYDTEWEAKLQADTAYANNLLLSFTPITAHAVLLPYIEGYRVVAEVISLYTANESPTEKDVLNKALAYGKQALLQRRISSPASIGKVIFQNAYKLLDSRSLMASGGEDIEQARREQSQEIRMLARRLERLRAISLQH